MRTGQISVVWRTQSKSTRNFPAVNFRNFPIQTDDRHHNRSIEMLLAAFPEYPEPYKLAAYLRSGLPVTFWQPDAKRPVGISYLEFFNGFIIPDASCS